MEGSPASGELSTILADLAQTLAGEVVLERLLPQIVSTARQATGARYGALGVLDDGGTTIVRFIHEGMDPDTVAKIGSTPTGGGLLGELITHPQLVVTKDLGSHPTSGGFPPHHPPMRAFIGTPVRAAGRVFGNLYLTEKEDGFDQRDVDVLTVLAAQAGLAIHAAQASTDLRATDVQNERERISRDLHDGVIQSLFSIGMGLEAVYPLIRSQPERVEAKVNATIDGLDAAIADLRSAIFTLRDLNGSVVSLTKGLVDLANEYRRNGELNASINVESSIDSVVPVDIVPDILHIVREALSNAARHAGSTSVTIEARTEEAGVLSIKVADRGSGFDPDRVTLGHGLGNMAERAAVLGADLRLDSKPTTGTTVALRIPLLSEEVDA